EAQGREAHAVGGRGGGRRDGYRGRRGGRVGNGHGACRDVAGGVARGDGEEVGAGLQDDAAGGPARGAGGGAAAAAVVRPRDLGGAGGGPTQAQGREARAVRGRGGGRREGHRGRRGGRGGTGRGACRHVVRGALRGDGEEVGAGLEDDAAGGPARGAGGGAVAAAAVRPRDLGDADVVGGRAAKCQRGAARSVRRRGGGRRDGHRGRRGVSVRDGDVDSGRGGRVAGSVVGPSGEGVCAVAHGGGVPGEGHRRRGQHPEDLAVLQVIDAGHADVV